MAEIVCITFKAAPSGFFYAGTIRFDWSNTRGQMVFLETLDADGLLEALRDAIELIAKEKSEGNT